MDKLAQKSPKRTGGGCKSSRIKYWVIVLSVLFSGLMGVLLNLSITSGNVKAWTSPDGKVQFLCNRPILGGGDGLTPITQIANAHGQIVGGDADGEKACSESDFEIRVNRAVPDPSNTVSSNDDWITVIDGTGDNNNDFKVRIEANTKVGGGPRTGTLTVSSTPSDGTKYFNDFNITFKQQTATCSSALGGLGGVLSSCVVLEGEIQTSGEVWFEGTGDTKYFKFYQDSYADDGSGQVVPKPVLGVQFKFDDTDDCGAFSSTGALIAVDSNDNSDANRVCRATGSTRATNEMPSQDLIELTAIQPQAGVDIPPDGGGAGSGTVGGDEDGGCNLPTALSWFLCPGTTMLGDAAAGLTNGISGLLSVNNSYFDRENGTFQTWTMMKNIANVVFVVVILIIVLSQVTGFGVSNYGIKKLLPKIAIGAILVNLSWYVSVIAVDLSNIVGSSIYGFIINIKDGIGVENDWQNVVAGILSTGLGVGVLAGAVALSGGWMALLIALIPILIGAVFAALMMFFTIMIREVAIIMLVAISPLAFACMILPNMEKWFNRWLKSFGTLLIIYPAVALLNGMGSLAAVMITSSNDNIFMRMMAMLLPVAPIVILPGMIKKSLSALGTSAEALKKLNSGVSKVGSTARKGYENSSLGKGLKQTAQTRKLDRIRSDNNLFGRQKLSARFAGSRFGESSGFARARGEKMRAAQASLDNVGRDDAANWLDQNSFSDSQMLDMITCDESAGISENQREALLKNYVPKTEVDISRLAMWAGDSASSGRTQKLANQAVGTIGKYGSVAPQFQGRALQAIGEGSYAARNNEFTDGFLENKVSGDKLLGADASAIEALRSRADQNMTQALESGDDAQMTRAELMQSNLENAARELLSGENRDKVKPDQMRHLQALVNRQTYTPTSTTTPPNP
jgi:hypothetical protein